MSMISPGCLFFTGIFTWILGLTSIGLWVGCYFECPTGRDTDFNYYVAVWTGVVAFFTGFFHMFFCCGQRRYFHKVCLWSAACCSFVLLPCSLLLATLSGYLSWREWDTEQEYQKEIDEGNDPERLQGNYVIGIALFATLTVVGALLLVLTLIFNCYHCCGNSETDEEEVEISVEPTPLEESPYGPKNSASPPASNQTYYSPPPPQYVREANTYRGQPQHVRESNTHRGPPQYARETHRGPTYHAHYSQTSRSRDYQYQDHGRSYRSRPAAPSTYYSPPQAMTSLSTARNPNNRRDHRYNYSRDRGYNSQPARMRWEEFEDRHPPPGGNPWSFGSTRSQNFY